MRLLLDTHTLIWLLSGDNRLSDRALKQISECEDVVCSIASFWEIGIKLGLKKADFQLFPNWEKSFVDELQFNGIKILEINVEHCAKIADLTWSHRDPFDRMLAVQAMVENRTIVSCDKIFEEYAVSRIW